MRTAPQGIAFDPRDCSGGPAPLRERGLSFRMVVRRGQWCSLCGRTVRITVRLSLNENALQDDKPHSRICSRCVRRLARAAKVTS